jgi:hypothetical protein
LREGLELVEWQQRVAVIDLYQPGAGKQGREPAPVLDGHHSVLGGPDHEGRTIEAGQVLGLRPPGCVCPAPPHGWRGRRRDGSLAGAKPVCSQVVVVASPRMVSQPNAIGSRRSGRRRSCCMNIPNSWAAAFR